LQHRVSQSLEGAVEQARQYVRRQLSQNVDETSWPEAHKPKWLWVTAFFWLGELIEFTITEMMFTKPY
jgi:hypothetical protein